MKLYYISIPIDSQIDRQTALGTIFDGLLPYSITQKLIVNTLVQLVESTGVIYDLVYINSYHNYLVQ